ncbi:MAG: Crp/Fnr family transcriptional regulator [Alphaproteobacteria bacterium]|nr:Crp/Fnr family transcriptional regulator [Alphaproteobacteria bacterium]
MDDTRRDIHNSEVPVVCQSCEARHNGVCGALNEQELVQLSKSTRRVCHLPGVELIGDSEEIASYSNIMHGVVKLSKILEDGRQQVVGLQFAPDFLGRIFATESRVTVETASKVELCKFPKSVFDAMLAANSELEHRIMVQTLRELDEARDWMVTLGRKTAAEKVASFLYLIATHVDPTAMDHPDEEAVFDLPLTRADIADYLGLTIETVSRQLTRLRADKVVEITHNRHVRVWRLSRLLDRCG